MLASREIDPKGRKSKERGHVEAAEGPYQITEKHLDWGRGQTLHKGAASTTPDREGGPHHRHGGPRVRGILVGGSRYTRPQAGQRSSDRGGDRSIGSLQT